MERLKTLFKKLTKKEYLPFCFFAGVQLIYHWMMREGPGTDAMWFFRNQLDAYSLKDYLTIRYHGWSSRLVIEAARPDHRLVSRARGVDGAHHQR